MSIKSDKGFLTEILVICAVYAAISLSGIGCPIKFLTGISCAGCGMTRAWIELCKLNFMKAFEYHPLFILPLIFVALYLIRNRMNIKVYKGLCIGFIAMFVVVYLIRMFDMSDTVVVFDIKNGWIFKKADLILGVIKYGKAG